ncbi:Ankyrin-2 [Colletotrichum spinosum]|uniref:Ankyrin-2 n=1 Tax=Colletotrichum spinosum TaxID=1347390 RepID=A0A4R8Q7J7_9PEZI|nr:Ankyrin-2 [Colletotrichum spinosum]
MVQFVIDAKSDPDERAGDSQSSPLHAASTYGDANMIRLLIAAGADKEITDTYAARPIHIALDWGMLQATEALLEAGAEADPQEVGPEPKVTAWTVRTLAEAASNGLDGCVRILLDKGADIKGTLNSRSALWYAALRGRLDVCRRLLEKGADPNECPEDYGPLLIKVVELDEDTEKILSLLRLLVDAGADVSVVDPSPNWRRNALTRAATLNKKEVVEFLLDKGANPDLGAFADCGVLTELGTDAVQTALYGAAWNGHIDIAKLLIDRGSNIHLQSQKKWTAFLAAYDNAELVKLLLEKGADINSVCSSGTIVHLASRNSHVKTLKVLLEHNPKPDLEIEQPDGLTALCVACQEGEVEIAKLLLVAGANKNHQTSGGDYPLKLCVVAGFDRVVRTLLSFQPDLTICDQGGNTILHQILNHGPSVSIFEMLLMAGANINAQNKDGETPLIVAAKVRNDDLFTFLLDRGADASITRPGQDSLLHVAASSGVWEIFKAVVDAGLTVPLATAEQAPGTLLYNAASSYKFEGKMKIVEYLVGEAKLPVNENCTGKLWQYALHAAAVAEDDAAVRYLVEKGADVRAVDTTGRTALHLAAYKCNGIAVDVLLRHGADPLARTKMGMLPIHFAAAHLTNSEGVDRLIREFAGLPVDSEDPQIHPSNQRETAAGKSAPKEGDKSRVQAHVNDRDGDGWTPLMWAAKNNYNNTHVLRSLLDHGADVWYREESSDRRWTPLKISRYYGAMPEIYELLEPEDKTRTRTDGSLEKWNDEMHQTREADYKTGYWCNHCCTLICGKRWHCLDCSHSFDLCYKCSANKDVLHGGAFSGHNFEAVEPEYTDPEPVSEQGRNTENGEEADEIKDGEDDPVKGGRETNEGEDIADMINLDDENNTDSDED